VFWGGRTVKLATGIRNQQTRFLSYG